MARAQKLLSPVRLSGDLSDLGTQQWTMSLNKSGFIVPTRLVTAPIIAGDATKASITFEDAIIFADAGGGMLSLQVYDNASNAGAMVTIKKIDTSTNVVKLTVNGSGEIDNNPDGADPTNDPAYVLQNPYDSVTLVAGTSATVTDGWWVI